jgi:hypothetical protein
VSSSMTIEFEGPVKGYEPDDRCALASVLFDRTFQAFTQSLHVKPLTAFYSSDPASLDHEIDSPDDRERLKARMGPAEYFQPSDALITISALLTRLRQAELPPIPGNRRKNLQSDLVVELSEIERSLQLAQLQDVRFYFDLVM